MDVRRIPFSLLLPLFSLVLWVVLFAVPTSFEYLHMQQQMQEPYSHLMLGGRPARSVSRTRVLAEAAAFEHSGPADFLNGINLPANFVELPVDRFLPAWPDTWHPEDFTVFSWRALTFPFYCLPFWWFAGRGLEALTKRCHPRWPTLLIGTILFAMFLLMAVGVSLDTFHRDEPEVNIPIVIGAVLWMLLLAAFPITWIRNWKTSCRSRVPIR